MWVFFAAALVVCAGILLIPGMLVNRALGFGLGVSVCFAAPVSVGACAVVGVVLHQLEIPCSWWVFAGVVIVISALIYTLGRISRTGAGVLEAHDARRGRWNVAVCGAYAAVGALSGVLFFVFNIDGPNSFSVQTDTSFHLSAARAMLDSGYFCTLHASLYPDAIVGGEGVFYPAAWHIVVAVASGLIGQEVVMAHNAFNFLIVSVIFPIGMFCFMRRLFDGNETAVVAGAAVTPFFAGFPWGFLINGQYDSNLLAYALVPYFLAQTIVLFEAPENRGVRLPGLLVQVAFSAIALTFAQTNSLFTAGVLLVPFLCVACWRRFGSERAGEAQVAAARSVVAVVVLLACVAAAWLLAYKLPFMQSVVQVERAPIFGKAEALFGILLLSYSSSFAPQPVLAALVAVGAAAMIAYGSRSAWMVASYTVSALLFFICASVEGPFRQLLCGFWYSGYARIAGMAAIAAIPLAAFGLASVVGLFRSRGHQLVKGALVVMLPAVLVGAVFAVRLPMPSEGGVVLGLQNVAKHVAADYALDSQVSFSKPERAFLDEVSVVVGDVPVVNIPADGSVWSYGAMGINVRYRDFYVPQNEEYAYIKSHLNEISYNTKVGQAVRQTGVGYVLMLDPSVYIGSYAPEDWKGIWSIDESTRGFTEVLSSEGMKLYRINEF